MTFINVIYMILAGFWLINSCYYTNELKLKKNQMKKLTMFLLAAVVGTSAAMAQDTTAMASPKMHHMSGMKKDCVMMKDGKMMAMKGGKTMAMDQDMTMTNGTTVSTDGTVKMSDGSTKQLKDGDCVYMNGKMMTGMNGMKKGTKMKKAAKDSMPM